MKYATLDTRNKPTGFYSEDIHGSLQIQDPSFKPTGKKTITDAPFVANSSCKIPKNAVPIPASIWQLHINGTEQVYAPLSKTWSTYIPTSSEMIAVAKTKAKATITSDYNALLEADIVYAKATFQADAASISAIEKKLTAIANAIANGWKLPTTFAWYDINNTPQPANLAYLQGLYSAIVARNDALFIRLQNTKAAINAAKTVATVQKITL